MESLDRWSYLNIEMDSLAKSNLHNWQECPQLLLVNREPWPLMHDGMKLVKDLDHHLYKIVHGPPTEKYWITKRKFPQHMAEHIRWEALEIAMTETPFHKRTFLSKHNTGMCGVGKFMKRWKQWDTNASPWCGQSEDASHVWKCQNQEACNSLHDLEQWMIIVNTKPHLCDGLLHYLNKWRNGFTPTTCFRTPPFTFQQESGWQSMIEGWVHRSWAERQHSHYSLLGSPRTGQRWLLS
jgi:hypothetical protein